MSHSQPYSLDDIPEGTTHVWTYALTHLLYAGDLLAFYRKDSEGKWETYSKHFGWRKSQNIPEWFSTETIEGYFKTLEEAKL